MDSNAMVQVLITYLDDSDEPDIFQPDKDFKNLCFMRWTAAEMIEALLDNPAKDTDLVLEEFALKMMAFAAIAKGTDEGLIFSIAAEFADDVLAMFREEKPK